MRYHLLIFCTSLLFIASCAQKPKAKESIAGSKPNILFILADDLGYGDLGCYGQNTIKTPNIDKLASQGLLFSQHYAGATVCAPSRNSLITGQHMGNTTIKTMEKPLTEEDLTVAETLQQSGYDTAMIGKWGLGDVGTTGYANDQGFDYSFGYYDQIRAHNHFPDYLMENGEKYPLKNKVVYVTDSTNYAVGIGSAATDKVEYSNALFTDKAVEFLESERTNPFFLYLAYTIPHANNESFLIDEHGMEVPDYGDYISEDWPDVKKAGAAMISELDSYVGLLMKKLKEKGLDENTIVIFTSDNGPHQEGGWDLSFFDSNGPLKGMKRDLHEGGIRVPFIARWPNSITPGTTDKVTTFWDFMPTACDLAGAETPNSCDGISYLKTLTGDETEQEEHEYLYWEFVTNTSKHAVRAGDYKLITIENPSQPNSQTIELYNIAQDFKEENNIADGNPEKVQALSVIIDKFK